MNLEATLQQLILDYQASDWVAVARDATMLVSEILAMFLVKPAAERKKIAKAHAALPAIHEADHLTLLQEHLADAQANPNKFDWSVLLPLLLNILQGLMSKP